MEVSFAEWTSHEENQENSAVILYINTAMPECLAIVRSGIVETQIYNDNAAYSPATYVYRTALYFLWHHMYESPCV